MSLRADNVAVERPLGGNDETRRGAVRACDPPDLRQQALSIDTADDRALFGIDNVDLSPQQCDSKPGPAGRQRCGVDG